MCGIVGLFIKNPALEARLGELISAMLVEMSERGPDSAGIAVYRNPAAGGAVKLVLFSHDDGFDWAHLAEELESGLGDKVTCRGPREPRHPGRARRAVAPDPALAARAPSRAAPDVGRHSDRDLQGEGAAARRGAPLSARATWPAATPSATPAWRPRVRSPPSTATRSRPGWICAWSTTARSATTTGCARCCAARAGSSSRPTTTARSRPAT